MATSADLENAKVKESYGDLLTCTICLETFKVPKYLPCLHTFCETCIHTYVVSSVKEDKPETFKCPICRRPVRIEECQGKANTWAKQLPGNHFVVSLIDQRELKLAVKQCNACERKNKSIKAVSWCTVCEEAYCDSCEESHKYFKMSIEHKVIQIKDVSENSSLSLSGLVACNEHPQKTIEVYCKDHSKPCCTLCATVHHRKCEQVVTIDKALYRIKESEKVKDLVKRLQESNENLEDVLQKLEQNIKTFETDTDTVLSKIETLRDNLIRHVKSLEENLRDELMNSKKQVTIKMNDEITELSSLKSNFMNWKNIIDACIADGSELHCLVKMEEILENLPQFDKRVSKLAREIKDTSISFEPNNPMSEITSLGRITLKGSTMKWPKGMRTVNFHSGKVKLLFTIDVIGGKQISGIFLNGYVLLSDYNGKVIKYDDRGTQIGELRIPGTSSDITKVVDWTVAVATNSTQIHIINAQSLTLQNTFSADVNTYGLSFVDNEYISSTYNNSGISWLDSSFKRIRIAESSESIYFVCCTSKNDYIYYANSHSIKRVSPEGTFSYKTDQHPFTYGTDFENNIYVAGHHSNAIHQLTPTCELIRVIPISSFASKPGTCLWVLQFEENSNRFLLTSYDTGKVLICQID
ncbi:E3 ubiquitin-protein ligase TRIM45-like [Mytilus galloprovincialis]|uniref:E3 ubiquitin-protein ligase TRIM45-like n=1 Tax=Mytilus galloprovincialis TaxID=29158 RepID=UPI003F7BBE0F